MASSELQRPLIIFLLHLITFIAAISPSTSQIDIWAQECTDAYGNYTSNRTYKSNLDKLLTNISTTNIPYGFYNFSLGESPDQVNAIALCRGDVVNVSDCHACLNFVISNLTRSCPTQMEAIGYAEKCMLRYSTRSILGGEWSNRPLYNLATGVDAPGDVYHFANVVEDLLMSLPNKTADGDSQLKFTTGEANVSASQKVYGLMQCTPDLIPSDCLGCLYWGMYYVLHSDRGQTGVRILLPSCSIRYELHKFYSSPPQQAAIPSPGKGSGNSKTGISVLVVVLACIFLFVIFLAYCCLRRRTKHSQSFVPLNDVDKASIFESLEMDFSTIRYATQNFIEANLLGRGGFGAVYKGTLASGKLIAVKRLERSSRQSDPVFENEVKIAAKLQHINLAEFLGYCSEDDERLLIFEFVFNRSLDYFLFDEVRRVQLDWRKRFIIIEGIAQGLQYLHQYSRNRIIHRDLKAANILLDEDFRPKITDFGTARLFLPNVTHEVTRGAAGTPGYKAPEYANGGEFSTRSDVYSYGILVLEIVAGRRIVISPESDAETWLTNVAWKNWINDTTSQTVDSAIASTGSLSEMERCIHIALLCVQNSAYERPKMSEVLRMLTDKSSLPNPSPPPFVLNSSDLSLALLQSRSSLPSGSATDLYPHRQ